MVVYLWVYFSRQHIETCHKQTSKQNQLTNQTHKDGDLKMEHRCCAVNTKSSGVRAAGEEELLLSPSRRASHHLGGAGNHPEWLTNIWGLSLHLNPQLRTVYYTSQFDPMLGYCLKGLRGAFSHPWNFPELHSCPNISQLPSTFSLFWSCNPSGVFWKYSSDRKRGGNPPNFLPFNLRF